MGPPVEFLAVVHTINLSKPSYSVRELFLNEDERQNIQNKSPVVSKESSDFRDDCFPFFI